jgi:hypothetical protein
MRILGLVSLLVIGSSAMARAQSAGQSTDIPDEYRPPKGMCRIWLKDVPPKQQPAPTDCAAAVKNVPPNGRVIFGDAAEKPKKDQPKEGPVDAKGFTGKTKMPPLTVKKPPLG